MRIYRTGIAMTEALLKLMTWLSPSYPIGAYTYSHGMEWAVETGDVRDPQTARDWISACLAQGAGRTDSIFLAHAWRAEKESDLNALQDLAELVEALAPAKERVLETTAQGTAFAEVTGAAWSGDSLPLPYPIAVGRAAAQAEIPLSDTLAAFLQAFAANLISAAVRLVPIGQTDGQRILASLMAEILAVAEEALSSPLDCIGGNVVRADIAAMRHETQNVRLFRS
ncbi:MAG: urease accessory protein UreF [Pseudomonadota bacterium]